jgi:hypothetical protein
MKSSLDPQIAGKGAAVGSLASARVSAVTQIRAHGSARRPKAPRDILVQPGPGGVLVQWKLPADFGNITGWRICVGTENNLAIDIRDKGTRQYFVPLTSGAVPPVTNLFLSAVNGFVESPKVQVQVQALPDATSPGPIPDPVPGYDGQFHGGLDQTQSGRPITGTPRAPVFVLPPPTLPIVIPPVPTPVIGFGSEFGAFGG